MSTSFPSTAAAFGEVEVKNDTGSPVPVQGMSVEITAMTYTDGLLTGYTENGVVWTIARNADGTMASVTSA